MKTNSQRRRVLALGAAILGLFLMTGCVQSVFPFYQDSDVVFDGNLAGKWVGEEELKPCLLNITGDSSREVRHYNFEFSKVQGGCPDWNGDRQKLTGGGQLLQLGSQRFVDVWDDDYTLHSILKIKADAKTLALVPIDPDLVADMIDHKEAKLQGRVDAHAMWPSDIILTSPAQDLRNFLREHADDKGLFSEKDAFRFHRSEAEK